MQNPAHLSTLGIVIPVYNDWNNLQKCLEAISILKYPKELLKVRIIDNGSNDWPKEVKFRSILKYLNTIYRVHMVREIVRQRDGMLMYLPLQTLTAIQK